MMFQQCTEPSSYTKKITSGTLNGEICLQSLNNDYECLLTF